MPITDDHERSQRSEHARQMAKARWSRDPQGLDEYIDRLVRRAPALTQSQRDRLALLLRGTAA